MDEAMGIRDCDYCLQENLGDDAFCALCGLVACPACAAAEGWPAEQDLCGACAEEPTLESLGLSEEEEDAIYTWQG
jgi:hypothetical protein